MKDHVTNALNERIGVLRKQKETFQASVRQNEEQLVLSRKNLKDVEDELSTLQAEVALRKETA